MPDPQKFEKQFFEALRDIFVGAKVEGDSGYVNLMRIKSRYFEQGVFPQLQRDINAALQPFPDFREELFDKLYTFFQRYFSESGSIYFRYTALHQNVYEKVYSDDRDVILFWKTHMLYYVKTDRIFTSLNVEVEGIKFFFDASGMTLKKSNEKRQVVYTFRRVDPEGTLVFDVAYSEKGKTTKVDDILKAVKQAGVKLSDETLAQAFRVFEKQSEVDYFINKNARAFLREQFELWMYQYLFAGQNVWVAERLAELQALKGIAFKVIDFISQFEDELVKIWNKPKFVRDSHYIITLDHVMARSAVVPVIASEAKQSPLLDRILAHPNFPAQVDEWRALGMLEDDFKPEMLSEKDLLGDPLHPQYRHLPLDTRHFPDLELDILAQFDDLDTALDGWLVHSENYQALSTLLPKFREMVKAIYIDPPYNTGDDEFMYCDKFQHSGWLTMMGDRLISAREFMARDGTLFAQIGDEEQANLKTLLESVMGEQNFRNAIIVRRGIKNVQSQFEDISALSLGHDTLLMFSKTEKARFPKLIETLSEGEPGKWDTFWRGTDRPTMRYEIFGKKPDTGQWRWSEDRALLAKSRYEDFLANHACILNLDDYYIKHLELGEELDFVRINDDGVVQYYVPPRNYKLMSDIWMDIRTRGSITEFPTEKHTEIIEKATHWVTKSHDLVLDFFAGSGTTAHAVMNLNRADGGKRKYILVEMGEHFNTVILPRIKKVAFCSKWKGGKPAFEKGESGMPHFVKYYTLEQYEDVLCRARYQDADLFDNPYEDPYHRYVFLRDLKNLDALEVDYAKNTINFHPERLYEGIDLAETLSNLRGKWIKRITAEYVEFEDGERISLTDPDWRIIKPLIWW